MNKTSTRGSGWKWDCNHFAEQRETFKLQNVSSPEHDAFCNALSATHNLQIQKEGDTVTFTPSSKQND